MVNFIFRFLNSSQNNYLDKKCYLMFVLCAHIFILASKCPELPSLPNGKIDCSPTITGFLNEVEACTFTCNPGFILEGSATRYCQEVGTWSGEDTSCKEGMFIILF